MKAVFTLAVWIALTGAALGQENASGAPVVYVVDGGVVPWFFSGFGYRFGGPQGCGISLAVDPANYVYMGSDCYAFPPPHFAANASVIDEYPPGGSQSPLKTFASSPGLQYVAVCRDETLYAVVNWQTEPSVIDIYANGSRTPTGQIAAPPNSYFGKITCDSSSHLYALVYSLKSSNPYIEKYGSGGTNGRALPATFSNGSPAYFQIDKRNHILVLVGATLKMSALDFFREDQAEPFRIFPLNPGGNGAAFSGPFAIASDNPNNVWLLMCCTTPDNLVPVIEVNLFEGWTMGDFGYQLLNPQIDIATGAAPRVGHSFTEAAPRR